MSERASCVYRTCAARRAAKTAELLRQEEEVSVQKEPMCILTVALKGKTEERTARASFADFRSSPRAQAGPYATLHTSR